LYFVSQILTIYVCVICKEGSHENKKYFLQKKPIRILCTVDDHTRHFWLLGMEAFQTIDSYSRQAGDRLRRGLAELSSRLFLQQLPLPYDCFLECVPVTHMDFFRSLVTFHENEDGIFVHGGLAPGLAPEDQDPDILLWGSEEWPYDYDGEKPVVYGHWDNGSLDELGAVRPFEYGRTIGIDTISLTPDSLPEVARRLGRS